MLKIYFKQTSAYSRVESSLESLNAQVRVESRVAGLDFKSIIVKSSQVNVDAQDALELQSISGLYTQLIIKN